MSEGSGSRRRTRVLWTVAAAIAVGATLLGVTVAVTGGEDDGSRRGTTDLAASGGGGVDTTDTTVELVPVTGAPGRNAAAASTSTTTRPASATTGPATAPVFLGATADAIAGIVTITFDQPVELAKAMHLVVFATDHTCGTPAGNAHAVVAGNGTATITLEATSFVPGTNFVRIVEGFVVGTRGRVPNTAVACTAVSGGPPKPPRHKTIVVNAVDDTIAIVFDQDVEPGDAARLTLHGNDPSCSGTTAPASATSIALGGDHRTVTAKLAGIAPGAAYVTLGEGLVLGTHGFLPNAPASCVRADAVAPPQLLGAKATIDGAQVTLALTFDRPVRPAHTDMYVTIHDEATCDGPNGNSHGLAGGEPTAATETITVTITGYVAGKANYLRIAPGFVTAADDGTPNAAVPCTAITT